MESFATFLEQNPLLVTVYGLHLAIGIFVPALMLYLSQRSRKTYNQKWRLTFGVWVFTSWGLFASFNLLYLVFWAIRLGGLGSVIGILFGLMVFGPIAGLFFGQAHQQWQKLHLLSAAN